MPRADWRPVLRSGAREFLIIFVGVALALAADDFRESNEERNEARESLRLVAADIRADSAELAETGAMGRRWASAAAWLIDNWPQSDVDVDSAEVALYQFTTRQTLELRRSGYDGLQNANRVRSVGNDSIRAAILQYYQQRQNEYVEFFRDLMDQAWTLHLERLAPHVENLGGSGGLMWPPTESKVQLRTSWASLTSDPLLHSQIVWLGRLSSYLDVTMRDGEALAGELVRAIEAEIGSPN